MRNLSVCVIVAVTALLASLVFAEERPRARDIGLIVGIFPTGEKNAITDVDGVLVGHTTRIEGDDIRTGVQTYELSYTIDGTLNAIRDEVHRASFVGQHTFDGSTGTHSRLRFNRHRKDIVKMSGVNCARVDCQLRLLNRGTGVGNQGEDVFFHQALDHWDDIRRVGAYGHRQYLAVAGRDQVLQQSDIARLAFGPGAGQGKERSFEMKARKARAFPAIQSTGQRCQMIQ